MRPPPVLSTSSDHGSRPTCLNNQFRYPTRPDSTEWIVGPRSNYQAYPSMRRTWEGNTDGACGRTLPFVPQSRASGNEKFGRSLTSWI